MTRHRRAALVAAALWSIGCGYYAPPIRPDADARPPERADARADVTHDTAHDAPAGEDDADGE